MVVGGIANAVFELRVCSVLITLYKEENMNAWEWSPPFSALWGVCNVHRHRVSRVDCLTFLFQSSLYEQVFPYSSSAVLFSFHLHRLLKFTAISVRSTTALRLSKTMGSGRCLMQILCLFLASYTSKNQS